LAHSEQAEQTWSLSTQKQGQQPVAFPGVQIAQSREGYYFFPAYHHGNLCLDLTMWSYIETQQRHEMWMHRCPWPANKRHHQRAGNQKELPKPPNETSETTWDAKLLAQQPSETKLPKKDITPPTVCRQQVWSSDLSPP